MKKRRAHAQQDGGALLFPAQGSDCVACGGPFTAPAGVNAARKMADRTGKHMNSCISFFLVWGLDCPQLWWLKRSLQRTNSSARPADAPRFPAAAAAAGSPPPTGLLGALGSSSIWRLCALYEGNNLCFVFPDSGEPKREYTILLRWSALIWSRQL